MTYYEKLKDRRWQVKRLEIMERAGFECEHCGDGDNSKQLHIHHKYYEKGKTPWEYPDESLVCLCGDCHKQVEELKLDLLKVADISDYGRIIGYAKAQIYDREMDELVLEYAEQVDGFLDGMGILCRDSSSYLCSVSGVVNDLTLSKCGHKYDEFRQRCRDRAMKSKEVAK